jgi:hypothetical protein
MQVGSLHCFYSIFIELSPFNKGLKIYYNFLFSNELYIEHDSHAKAGLGYAQNMNK